LESVRTFSPREEMRIMINDYAGHPFQVQLSRELALRGNEVLHTYFASDITPRGNLKKSENDVDTFNIKGISLGYEFDKYSFIKRRKQEIKFGHMLIDNIIAFKPDVLICSNTPLDPLNNIRIFCKKNGIKFIVWLQDIISFGIENILSKKIGVFALPFTTYYKLLEKIILKDSQHIIGISNGFEAYLEKIGINTSKITIIPNWSPIEEVPVCHKNNIWSQKYQISDKTVLLYAGTLGMKHNPQLLIDLAQRFRGKENIIIVVITEGLGASFIKESILREDLSNILLLPFQPFSELPKILGSADLLLAILEKEAGKYSVPSKVLTYFCSGRPVLLSVPNDNLAFQIVVNENLGIAVNAHTKTANQEFVDAAVTLLNSPLQLEAFRRNTRQYAEANFNIREIASKFLTIIQLV
jgi:colanic acid biosynthesis glycosyl transferase WcaI